MTEVDDSGNMTKNNWRKTTEICLQLDDETLHRNETLFFVYARFSIQIKIIEKLLFTEELEINISGSITYKTGEFFQRYVTLPNTTTCESDDGTFND